jgi:hypothetical protein
MTLRLTCSRLGTGLAAGATGALLLSGVAYAITSNSFDYSVPKTGWLSVNAAAMVPEHEGLSYTNRVLSSSLEASGPGCFQGAVNFPDRAKINGFLVWSAETSPGQMVFYLFRNRLSNGTENSIVAADSTDTSGRRVLGRYPIRGSAVIANDTFSYGLAVCFNGPATFYGARVTYTYETAGD